MELLCLKHFRVSKQLTLGPDAKTPIRIPLAELDSADAAAYATKVFAEVKST